MSPLPEYEENEIEPYIQEEERQEALSLDALMLANLEVAMQGSSAIPRL